MKPITKVVLLSLIFSALAVLVAPREAEAIPAFARKYSFSCTTCHAPAPRLKEFGEEFAGRGFRLEDPAQEPRRAEYDTGDPLLRLARTFPLAVRMEGFGAYDSEADADTDFETPWVFKILSGGPLTDTISYYFYFIIEENDVEGLEDAFLQFNDLFGSGIDMVLGQFQVSDPLFKRELRLERNDYAIYTAKIGSSQANLTYDRGLIFSGTAPGDMEVVLQIVNGNGKPKGTFDNDGNKNIALRLAKVVGGARLGVFAYDGKEENGDAADRSNRLSYFGPDLSWGINDRWHLNLQYLVRKDSDPLFVGYRGSDYTTDGGFAELHYFPQGQDGRWAVSALYNLVDSDLPDHSAEDASLSLNYLLARNIRLLTEVRRDLEEESTQFSLGVVAAF